MLGELAIDGLCLKRVVENGTREWVCTANVGAISYTGRGTKPTGAILNLVNLMKTGRAA